MNEDRVIGHTRALPRAGLCRRKSLPGRRLRHEQNRGLDVLVKIQQKETPRWTKSE
jgi:hypothetical protein